MSRLMLAEARKQSIGTARRRCRSRKSRKTILPAPILHLTGDPHNVAFAQPGPDGGARLRPQAPNFSLLDLASHAKNTDRNPPNSNRGDNGTARTLGKHPIAPDRLFMRSCRGF